MGLCLGAETVSSEPGDRGQFQGKCCHWLVPQTPSCIVGYSLSVSWLYVSLSVFDVILQGPSERNVRGLLLCLALVASGDGAVVPMGGYVNEGGDLWCRRWFTAFSKATVARLF